MGLWHTLAGWWWVLALALTLLLMEARPGSQLAALQELLGLR